MIGQRDDIELIKGCIRGVPAMQKELVRRYAASLMSVARRYARHTPEAEDILQEAFISIFEKISTYDPNKGALGAWMRRIVVNKALMLYRKAHFQLEQSTDQLPETLEDVPEQVSPLNYDEIMALVAQLPEYARVVFNMAVIDGYKHEEIAEALQIPPGTSRSLLSRARKILQAKMIALQKNELAGI